VRGKVENYGDRGRTTTTYNEGSLGWSFCIL